MNKLLAFESSRNRTEDRPTQLFVAQADFRKIDPVGGTASPFNPLA